MRNAKLEESLIKTLKYTHEEVDFEHPAKGPNHCSECRHFHLAAGHGCSIVEPPVTAPDWCKKFERRPGKPALDQLSTLGFE